MRDRTNDISPHIPSVLRMKQRKDEAFVAMSRKVSKLYSVRRVCDIKISLNNFSDGCYFATCGVDAFPPVHVYLKVWDYVLDGS